MLGVFGVLGVLGVTGLLLVTPVPGVAFPTLAVEPSLPNMGSKPLPPPPQPARKAVRRVGSKPTADFEKLREIFMNSFLRFNASYIC